MVAPFGFSVGDFVAGLKLLSDVIGALRDTTHATSEYQTTIVDLQTIYHILGKVQARYSLSSGESSLDPQLALCIDLYAQHIAKFIAKLHKYETAFALPTPAVVLNLGGIDNLSRRKQLNTIMKHNVKRITWALKVKTDVEKLMIAVGPRLAMIGLYLRVEESKVMAKRQDGQDQFRVRVLALEDEFRELAACVKSSAVVQSGIVVTERELQQVPLMAVVEDVEEEQAVAGAEREDDKATASPAMVDTGETAITVSPQPAAFASRDGIPNSQRLDRVRKGLEHSMFMILLFSQALQTMFLTLANMPRAVSLLHSDNIHITDALGRVISRPYTDFRYFEIVKAHLNVAFRNCDGSLKIQRRNFGLFRQVGGRERILHEGNWERCVTPGSKISMSMFVEGGGYGVDSCPRCGTGVGGLDEYGWTTW